MSENEDEFHAKVRGMVLESYGRGVADTGASLIDSFRMVALKDKPEDTRKFTALDIIRILEGFIGGNNKVVDGGVDNG
tara:strand:+ start:125 stop:358 length:234 start_codon:yes stop_codon:yes gene_type:complete